MAEYEKPVIDLEAETIEAKGNREPWERRASESRRAYAAFTLYLNSPDRKLAGVAAALVPKCSVPNVARWSAMHNWKNRALEFDRDQDEQFRAQMARDRAAMNRRHIQLALLMQSIGAAGLAELQAKREQKLPLNLSANEAQGLLDAATNRSALPCQEDRNPDSPRTT